MAREIADFGAALTRDAEFGELCLIVRTLDICERRVASLGHRVAPLLRGLQLGADPRFSPELSYPRTCVASRVQ